MLNDTPTSAITVLRLIIKGKTVDSDATLIKTCSFPKIVGIILPVISLWNYPAHNNTNHAILRGCSHLLRWPTLCGVYFSLKKSISYLSLCLSLNSFCDGTSRNWVSVSPEIRCDISYKTVGSSPNLSYMVSVVSFGLTSIKRRTQCLGNIQSINQFNHLVMSNSLQLHGLQHAKLPWPSPTPEAYSNSCLSHQWCHPTMSSSVVPFSSCLQSFLALVNITHI